jgi:hypothetical protein
MIRGYFSHEIRGVAGDKASEELQVQNLDLSCQKAQVIRRRFPDVNLFVPHEIEVFNNLYFDGKMSGDDIVDIEKVLILSHLFDFVVVVGECHQGTGVDAEAKAAHLAGIPVIFLDDVEEASLEVLAQRLATL